MEKIIFIAGPVRGDGSREAQLKNVTIAKQFADLFIDNQIPFYSPHLNVDQEIIESGKSLSKFSWDLNAAFLRRCDALAVLPGWENSSGTKEEIENAAKRNIPVFYLTEEGVFKEMKDWLQEN